MRNGQNPVLSALCFMLVLGFLLKGPEAWALEVVAYPSTSVTISSSVAGQISEMLVDEGEQVDTGALLARLESEEDKLEIERLEKILEKKRFDTGGLDKLLKDNMTSRDEALQAKMEMELTEIEITRARLKLDRKSIFSPLGGRVVNRYHQVGEWVGPGEPLFQVIDMKSIKCRAFLRAGEAVKFALNKDVALVFPKPLGRVTGRIVYLDPRFDIASGLSRMEILVDNPGMKLRPGMRGEMVSEEQP